MIYFVAFFVLHWLSHLAVLAAVPWQTRYEYARCHRDAVARAAWFFSHAIWVAALAQYLISPIATPWQFRLMGICWLIAGRIMTLWAMRVNPFFVPVIAQPGWIVSNGPYADLRHPGYCGLAITAIGTAYFLGQQWSAIPLVCYLGILWRRAVEESRFLDSLNQKGTQP